MQEYEDQYGEIDYRKVAVLVAGVLLALAAIIITVCLFVKRTDASTEKEIVALTPERIEEISDEVGDRVLDTLSTGVLADMVARSVKEEVSGEKIYDAISQSGGQIALVSEGELQAMIEDMLLSLGINGTDVFTKEQKASIKRMVAKAMQDYLSGADVTQLLADEEKQRLKGEMEEELLAVLRPLIENSSYQLRDEDIAAIQGSLDLDKIVSDRDGSLSKQQLEKLKTEIMKEVQKSVDAQVKGADYLSGDEIETIQERVLEKAGEEMRSQIQSLTDKIKEVKTSVSGLAVKVKDLKQLDKSNANDLTKLQGSVKEINASIRNISSVTEELTKAVNVTGNGLTKVTGTGSKVKSDKVSANKMTVAEFVDILAGNDNAYTGAIQELDKIVGSLREENAKQDSQLQKCVTELGESLNDSNTELDDVRKRMESSNKDLKEQLEQGNRQLKEQLDQDNQQLKEQSEQGDEQLKEQLDNGDKELKKQLDESGKQLKEQLDADKKALKEQSDENDRQLKEQLDASDKELKGQLDAGDKELKEQLDAGDRQLKEHMDKQTDALQKTLETEQQERKDADEGLQSQVDATDAMIGDGQDAGKVEGETIFQKIGAIVKILSKDGLAGFLDTLKGIGAATVEEGVANLNTDLTDARTRVSELEKEKWYSNITLLAQPTEGASGYTYLESGSAYVYQIPLISESDQIDLNDDRTAIVVEFKKPGRLPSNVAFSTSGNDLLITFTNKPSRNIEITSIHVYKQK